ncbi:MAG: ribonuclease H-like domain-containing protein [Tissierellia bacterium]|nr:ribonuclease H-like domain-containing protein [Tissierellia bacterium]
MKIIKENLSLKPYLNFLDSDEKALFLDIETTGLNRRFNTIYIIGILEIDSDEATLTQYFALKPSQEKNILDAFYKQLDTDRVLITYNGRFFDIPFIESRAKKYGIESKLSQMKEFDLLRFIKKQAFLLKSKDNKQKTWERYLGISRKDKYTGGELIKVYNDYTKVPDLLKERDLLLHNREDLINLSRLTEIVKRINTMNTIKKSQYDFLINTIELNKDTIIIEGNTNKADFISYDKGLSFEIENGKFLFKSPTMKDKYDKIRSCNFLNLDDEFANATNQSEYHCPDDILLLAINNSLIHENCYELLDKYLDRLI